MSAADSVILVFAKAPEQGAVKTRLIPALGERGATRLYRELLYHLMQQLLKQKVADIEFWCAPDTSHADFKKIQSVLDCKLYEQVGVGLGERMAFAVQCALHRYQHVVVIGVDCPGLTHGLLQQTICCLADGYNAVLGPAEDGGYVLLGLNQTADCLFDNMPWGSDRIAGLTRDCFARMGWEWLELPEMWDVDRAEDLSRLKALDWTGNVELHD